MSDIRSLAEDYVMGWLDPDVRGRVDARIAAPSTDEDRLLAKEVPDLQAPKTSISEDSQ